MNGQEFIINIYEPFMFIHEYSRSAAGRKEETNYRNTHNLSRNGHNIMCICGAITRITRIRFIPHEWISVCDATRMTANET